MCRIFLLLITLVSFSLFSCKTNKKKDFHNGFYYWKSKFHLTDKDQKLLLSLNAEKIYVKFFDVEWDDNMNEPRPFATIQPSGLVDSSIQIIPTIFITNKTMLKLDDYQLARLSRNVFNKINQLINCFDNEIQIKEIQIDCDWNESTRSKYFKFLTLLKSSMGSNIKLSSTIRLHQVKYQEKTGVPPVDRGMLMFYNMGEIDKLSQDNSIFNTKEASKYLTGFEKYPLPLDLALPTFSWAAIYRDGKLIQLITEFDQSLSGNKNLIETSPNIFTAQKPIDLKTFLVQKNDIVKFEIINPEVTKEAAELIKPHLKDPFSVILFDYNSIILKRYNEKDFKTIFDTFN